MYSEQPYSAPGFQLCPRCQKRPTLSSATLSQSSVLRSTSLQGLPSIKPLKTKMPALNSLPFKCLPFLLPSVCWGPPFSHTPNSETVMISLFLSLLPRPIWLGTWVFESASSSTFSRCWPDCNLHPLSVLLSSLPADFKLLIWTFSSLPEHLQDLTQSLTEKIQGSL